MKRWKFLGEKVNSKGNPPPCPSVIVNRLLEAEVVTPGLPEALVY